MMEEEEEEEDVECENQCNDNRTESLVISS
jgi:hypothetical protein